MSYQHHPGSFQQQQQQRQHRQQQQQQHPQQHLSSVASVTTSTSTQPSYTNINNISNNNTIVNDNNVDSFCEPNNVRGTILGRTTSPLTGEIAIDCEMVEATKDGKKISVLARVSLVNSFCQLILDTYVKPMYRVSDYRTPYSGIRREHLEDAPRFKDVRDCVVEIISGRVLIGHDLVQDLAVLDIRNLPNIQLRDTSECYRSFFKVNERPSLKRLAAAILDRDIQRGAHDSIEDAMTAMLLYKYWLNSPPQEPK